MKKTIIIIALTIVSIHAAYTQKWENYFQFGVGTGYLKDANINDSPLLLFEYGKTYKWIDFVVALESANTASYDNQYVSLILKTKFDFVRMFFENSRHSFKLGTGVGIGTTNFHQWYDIPDNISHYSANYTLFSVMASYEYEIANKTSLGVFFNNYPSHYFFGLHYFGLSIRRNF
jgi:hypothetical protein